jgi:hypothetical protein
MDNREQIVCKCIERLGFTINVVLDKHKDDKSKIEMGDDKEFV